MPPFSPNIALGVRRKDDAIQLYQEVLDMELIEETTDETILQSGRVRFYLQNSDEPSVYFEFAVDDLEETMQELERRGCESTEVTTPEGDVSYLVHDPFGMNYHLFAH